MSAALETSGLGRRYRMTWALRDCTLTVPEGSVTGLVGPNGAGKSTLLRLAVGLTRPTTGSVAMFGTPVEPTSGAHLPRVGYLDQQRPLYGHFTVSEMLKAARLLNPRWDDEAATAWIEELGIPRNKRIRQLSGGQQAQVALTICMAKRPDLLVLDEPVASLDPLARRRLFQALMGTVADRGTTVFLSSHIVSELEPLCDHLIVLSSSRVQLEGRIENLLGAHRLLVGPAPDLGPPQGVTVIHGNRSRRQVDYLVRGTPTGVGPGWQVLEPDLEEVVLAYMASADSRAQTVHPPLADVAGV